MSEEKIEKDSLVYKSVESDTIEKGLLDIIKPYIWKIAVTVLCFIVSTLSYFVLRNSQNTSQINGLQGFQSQQSQLNEDQRQYIEKLEIRLATDEAHIEALKADEQRTVEYYKMLVNKLEH